MNEELKPLPIKSADGGSKNSNSSYGKKSSQGSMKKEMEYDY